MFEDTIENVMQTKENFSGHVRDSFGNSIVSDIMDPLESEEQKLCHAYEAAEVKMTEIKVITAELRLLI